MEISLSPGLIDLFMREFQPKPEMPTCGVLRYFEKNLQPWLVFLPKKLAQSIALSHPCP